MAITFPYDLLSGFPGFSSDFKLYRRQEQSRTAGGKTIVKDIGDPLWTASYVTKDLTPNQMSRWRARLEILDGSLNTFRAYDLSRCYPIAHPRGAWPGGVTWNGQGTIASIAANRKELSLTGLPSGLTLGQGDMFMIGAGKIFRVGVGGVANSGGALGTIEVRPHLPPSIAVGATVTVVRPWCLMNITPESADTMTDLSGRGPITFEAMEALS